MKIIIGILVFGLLLGFGCIETQQPPVACTMEAKMCPDGSYVGRAGPDCEFEACPEPKSCDALAPCDKEGYECYDFKDSNGPICYMGDPCFRCASGNCVILESYPMQVSCITEEAENLNCESYDIDDCPEGCLVCPPCPECSSLTCQIKETCEGMGFDKEWSETVTG